MTSTERAAGRRTRLALVAAAVMAALAPAQGRVIVIGVDGFDFEVCRELMAEGKLPALQTMSKDGAFIPLYPTNPAQSPVSWATLTTGLNPGATGIFDFLRRDFTHDGGVAAQLAYNRKASDDPRGRGAGRLLLAGIAAAALLVVVLFVVLWIKRRRALALTVALASIFAAVALVVWVVQGMTDSMARALTTSMKLAVPVNARDGKAVWETLDGAGVPTMSILAPMAFPAPALDHGRLLSGLGVPDAMGTPGTYTEYRDEPIPADRAITQTGCRVLPLRDEGSGTLVGIRVTGPRLSADGPRYELPLAARVDRASRRLSFPGLEGVPALGEREWSPFIPVEFPAPWFQKIPALTRFYVVQAGERVAVHQEPPCFDPRRQNGFLPITSPMSFGADLASDGLFDTCGWGCATNPLQDEVIDEATFLSDIAEIERQRDRVLWRALRESGWKMFFCVLSTPDRIQHVFWRDRDPKHPRHDPEAVKRRGDPIREAYQRIDALIAKVRTEVVKPGDLLLVVSDHGFAPWREQVNLNRFLAEEGFLVGKGDQTQRTLETSLGGPSLFPGIDWKKTRAYSMGLGKIYVNLEGEGTGGTVAAKDRRALLEDIRRRLLALRHEGAPVVRSAALREELYHGDHVDESADLIVGFERGFRISWQCTLGSVDEPVIAPNRNLWSGDHCSVDPTLVPGVLFCSRAIDQDSANVADVAPTIEGVLGVTPPAPRDGKPLRFRGQ